MTDMDDPNESYETSSAQPPPPGFPPPSAPSPRTSPSMPLKTPDERKQLLARAIANNLAQGGMRVETQSDFNAVLVQGHPCNHVLHLIITIFTCLLWGPVWIVLAVTQKEKRHMLAVDEYGNVQMQNLS